MHPKNTLPISEARKRIFEIAEEVQKPGVYYVLTEKGRPKAVMLSYEEYDSLIETLEVMEEVPELDKLIKEVDEDVKSGRYKSYTSLEEILAKEGFVLAEKSNYKYNVSDKIRKAGEKNLEKLPEIDRLKIITAFAILAQNPFLGKKLGGKLTGIYSYRIWPYRILYKIYKEHFLVVILNIAHRKDVYK
jgi:prevent-host-death family protein